MKLTFVLMLSALLQVRAGGYAQQITLSENKAPLEKILKQIGKQSGYDFFYNATLLRRAKPVSVHVQNVSLEEALEQSFAGQPLRYTIEHKTVVVQEATQLPQPVAVGSAITVTGKVVDEKGNALPGATVRVQQTDKGTATDAQGVFVLQTVDDKAVLEISFLGYQTQQVAAAANLGLIQMQVNTAKLEEVVVTALGVKQEEKALGYAVQKVDGSVLQKAPEANILSNLTGKVAGLTVYNNTEFYQTPSISLRGESPLIVIDGVPVSTNFWNVSPNDVEEMSVLKGATASALYGSRGAGGAIMITTKKGAAGKLNISFNTSTMFKAGYIAIPEPQTVYGTGDNGLYRYGDGAGGGVNDAGSYVWGPRMDVRDPSTASGWKEIAQWDSPVDPVTGARIPTPWVSRGKNNLKNFLETEYITTNNISVSQSSEKGSFRASISHAYQKGQVPNTKLNNSTLNLGGTINLLKKLNLESSFTYNKQFSPNNPATGYGGSGYVYNLLIWSGVDLDIRDFRNYWLTEDVQQRFYQYTPWYNNPYFLAYENERGYYQDGGYGFVTLNYDIAAGLKLTNRTGVNSQSIRQNTKTPISLGQGLGNYSESSSSDFAVNNDLLLTYDKSISSTLDINALVGGTINFNEYRSLSAATDGLNVPGFFSLSNSTNPVSASNYLSKKQVNSLFGKLSFAYRNGLFLDLTGRNDWSSSLPKETRSYFYPSVAFSGVLSQFVTLPDVVSFVKFRGSWTLSKKDIGLYSIRPSFSVNADVWEGQSTASYPGAIRGADVKPEETRTYEVGTDMRFFDSRLKLDVSYYNTLRFNMITNASISDASGFNSKTTNTDERFEKRGFEVVLSGQPVQHEGFSWDTQVNWSTYRWYWNRLDPDFSPNKGWVSPGARMDYYVGWDWARDPQGNIIHSNGYPVWESNQSVLGHTGSDYVWGWSNNIQYKNFSLGVSLDGRVGGIMHSQTNQAMWNSGAHPKSVNEFREAAANGIATYVGNGVVVVSGELVRDEQGRIVSDNRQFAPNETNVNYITYMKRFNPYVGSVTSQNLFDQTFLKLREVSLSYNLPQNLFKGIGITGASVGLIGRNLWLWTKEVEYVDPDGGADDLSSASYRNVGFNVNISF